MFEVKAYGIEALLRMPQRLAQEIDRAEKRAVERHGATVLRRLVERITWVGATPHPEFLRVKTAALKTSAAMTNAQKMGIDWVVRVGFRRGKVDPYAPVHEYGGSGKGRAFPPRAPVRRSALDSRGLVMQVLKEEVEEALKRVIAGG